ncbi:MAG TPA: (2Fe-2S)-binding protein, partial [Solirubrobacteraceae bacterium]|nr:(2Fe-2S)-binding protein [Solirubrobacteraceae bacterium]
MADKRAKHRSKYTIDRGVPGAFEGETITRRRLMTGTAHGAGAVAASSFLLPALGFAIGPIFKSTPAHWEVVGT